MTPQADIRPCNPDQAGEAALAEYYELAVASAKIDRPHEPAADYERVIGRLCGPSSDADTIRHWFAYRAGKVVGHMTVSLPMLETLHVAMVENHRASRFTSTGHRQRLPAHAFPSAARPSRRA